jgi:hypothetical protein
MFFETVPITSVIGTTPAQIFDQYGIDHGRFAAIAALPANAGLRGAGGAPLALTTPLTPGRGEFVIPIDFDVRVVTAVPRVEMRDGLRPLRMVNGVVDRSDVSQFTHGVEIVLARTGRACKRIRWVQTIKDRNSVVPNKPLEFVDIGGNDTPWYNGDIDPDSIQFEDIPCGPQATAMRPGLEFTATVSAAVWTMERVTLAACFTYGFRIRPGTTLAAVQWNPTIRAATGSEIAEHIRILELGINQFRRPTGGRLVYNPPPANGAVNAGILFGRF